MPKRSSGFFLSLSVALSVVVVVVVVLYFCCHRHKLFRISSFFPEQLGQSYSNSAQSIFRWRECKCVNSFTGKVEPGKQPRVWYIQVCSNHNPSGSIGTHWESNFYIQIFGEKTLQIFFSMTDPPEKLNLAWKHPRFG